ncbi:hypothetical protein [Streptomyces sp. cmx-4-9]|uniref:hypothetical protein n=1 Tax=Streptomyces sp. cmx-4-9 TaxID=2790941 RepID=UPI00397EAEA5
MRTHHTTLRSSLVVVTATAALSLGVASGAFAAPGGRTAPAVTASATAGAAATAPAPRVFVKTVELAAPGHTARLYRTSPYAYQAEVFFHGRKTAAIAAKDDSSTATNLNGLTVQLTSQGRLSSWIERAQPRPVPRPADQRVLVRTEVLPDGCTARIYRLGATHYQADLHGTTELGTLDADGRPTAAENNGLHLVLRPDGTLASWWDGVPAPARGADAPAPDASGLRRLA